MIVTKDVTSGSALKFTVLHVISPFARLEAKAKQCSTLVDCTGQGMKLTHSMAKQGKQSALLTHSMS